jgi:hypothetical protein
MQNKGSISTVGRMVIPKDRAGNGKVRSLGADRPGSHRRIDRAPRERFRQRDGAKTADIRGFRRLSRSRIRSSVTPVRATSRSRTRPFSSGSARIRRACRRTTPAASSSELSALAARGRQCPKSCPLGSDSPSSPAEPWSRPVGAGDLPRMTRSPRHRVDRLAGRADCRRHKGP